LNTNAPLFIAILRGAYTAAGAGALMFLTVLSASSDMKVALIAGGIAALVALGFRGGVEGVIDQRRANKESPAAWPRMKVTTGNVTRDIPSDGPLYIGADDHSAEGIRRDIPAVDFDEPYHRTEEGEAHIGHTSKLCPLCNPSSAS